MTWCAGWTTSPPDPQSTHWPSGIAGWPFLLLAGTTNYTLYGKNIVHMTQGSNNLHFFYDASNKPAIVEYNGTKYAYVHNLQGDIVAILDNADAKQYCFDNMLLGATRSISFESFTFLDNVSLDLIYPQRGYPYRFNLFAYSDSLCTLLFLGYYSSNDAQQIERKLAETAFPEFISLVYSDCFSSASQLVD